MKQKQLTFKFVEPPKALKNVRNFDNIALVPASLLKNQGKYQTITRNLPKGGILLCEAPQQPRITRILSQVAAFLREQGHFVKTLPYSTFV